MSPLTQGRGLKYPLDNFFPLLYQSPLTQGRGLKSNIVAHWIEPLSVSPLTQGRGLKFIAKQFVICFQSVAPHAGAWIEIIGIMVPPDMDNRRPSRRGVD